MFSTSKPTVLTAASALPGRETLMTVPVQHFVNQRPIMPPFPDGVEVIYFGMGCFWGAERLFWQKVGLWTTAVGYAGGYTPNPLYDEVCSGMTGHVEVVLAAFQSDVITCQELLQIFWEKHDPTQGMQQGNDRGTQYRSVIYTTTPEQFDLAINSKQAYQHELNQAGYPDITTEIEAAPAFYYAEEYHQQYLAKNPDGYCGIKGTGVCLI